jgi:phage shock protein C
VVVYSYEKIIPKRTNRKVAGVCGGIGEYFGLDATIIRVVFVIQLFPGWLPGFIPYVILWIFVRSNQFENRLTLKLETLRVKMKREVIKPRKVY